MAGYKVEICGVNTSDLPLLKPAQAKELLVKIKSGDTQARETLKGLTFWLGLFIINLYI